MCANLTKSIQSALDRRESWESRVDLDPGACKELKFWKNYVSHLNPICLFGSFLFQRVS